MNLYLLPLLVLWLRYRRIGRTRQVRVDRLRRLSLIVAASTAWALWASGVPPPAWLMAYAGAAVAGAAVGYVRSSSTPLSVSPENGHLESRQTAFATTILMGLFAIKFGIALLFPELNGGRLPDVGSLFLPHTVEAVQTAQHAARTAATVNYATDTLLVFSGFVFVAGAAETWRRAARLLTGRSATSGRPGSPVHLSSRT